MYLLDRIKEPSTWAGLGTALVALGLVNPAEFEAFVQTLVTVVGGLMAFVGALMPDGE